MAAASPRPVRTRAELSEAPHGAAQVAEDRWRRCVEEVSRRRCRARAYREAQAALEALHAAYGGAAPVEVVRRLEAHVLLLLNRGSRP